MSFSNITQNPPLGQMSIEPLDEWLVAMENLTAEGDAGSVNIPYLLGISVSIGNAMTKAIGKNAVVFTDPEWDEGGTGMGKATMFGGSGEGGGVYVGW